MVLQHSSVKKSLLWHNKLMCQSRDFPTELCGNTIIVSLLFYRIDLTSFLKIAIF